MVFFFLSKIKCESSPLSFTFFVPLSVWSKHSSSSTPLSSQIDMDCSASSSKCFPFLSHLKWGGRRRKCINVCVWKQMLPQPDSSVFQSPTHNIDISIFCLCWKQGGWIVSWIFCQQLHVCNHKSIMLSPLHRPHAFHISFSQCDSRWWWWAQLKTNFEVFGSV